MARTKLLICPYCGETQREAPRCAGCGGLLEPLSRQATHNAMGPWFIRDEEKPHHPGCSYETLVMLIDRGQVEKYSIIRGPTSKQFWTVARHVPGVAHLLGYCHQCDAEVDPADHGCPECGALFGAWLERNHLGLPEVSPLPGDPGEAGEVGDVRDGHDAGVIAPDPYQTWESTSAAGAGISSFASDAELVRQIETPSPMASEMETALVQSDAGDMAVPAPAVSRAGGGSERESDLPAGDGLVYALQRTIAQKQRSIRWLAGLLLAAVLGLTITTLVLIGQSEEGAGVSVENNSDSAPVLPREEEELSEGALPADSVFPPLASDLESSGVMMNPDPRMVRPRPDLPGRYTRLRELVDEGNDPERTSNQRLQALREAEGIWLKLSGLSEDELEGVEGGILGLEEIGKRIQEGIEREEFFAEPSEKPRD